MFINTNWFFFVMVEDFNELIKEAKEVYSENFDNIAWFGRCIFMSWYCDLGTCKFCFRSTTKHKIKHAKSAKRSVSSLLTDALIGRNLGWRIEFLTGGYRIFSFDEMLDIIKKVSHIFQQKIWLNLGVMEKEQLEMIKPYVEGVCASIETAEPKLHDLICPDKPIQPYSDFLDLAEEMGFKKSMTIVVGLGEKKEDIGYLFDFIEKHNLDRITFYALKPVQGTGYTKSPEPEYYAWWIAKTRIRFPKLEIIAGLTPKQPDYTKLILDAGANAITKFPVLKKFNSPETQLIEKMVRDSGREFVSVLNKLPEIDWDKKIDELEFDDGLKEEIRQKLGMYLKKMRG
ncbi:MAG: radical SAM protein [Nanoarchaeota archaeon]|nr:radical SAM protein [Nanoarchaeota archaeon]